MTAINNSDDLDKKIIEALGDESTKALRKRVRLLCEELMREVQDECISAARVALNNIENVTKIVK